MHQTTPPYYSNVLEKHPLGPTSQKYPFDTILLRFENNFTGFFGGNIGGDFRKKQRIVVSFQRFRNWPDGLRHRVY